MTPKPLVDRIYEAAFLPEFWPRLLDDIGALTESAAGTIFVFDEQRPVRFQATKLVEANVADFCAGPWKASRRMQYFQERPFTGFVVAADYFTTSFLEEDGAYISRTALGLDSQLGTIMPMPTGETVVYAFDRWREDGAHDARDIAAMNLLHPHLARSGMIASRLGLERAVASTQTLQVLGMPAAVVGATGKVLAANPLFEGLNSLFLPVAFDRLAILDVGANRLLQSAIEAEITGHSDAVRSVPIPGDEDRPACVIHMIPLRRNASDLFQGGALLLAVSTARTCAQPPPPEILIGLFDLTPSEARFAALLASGASLKQAAAQLDITVKSARTYLERIFGKTGRQRQTDLVTLLRSLYPFT